MSDLIEHFKSFKLDISGCSSSDQVLVNLKVKAKPGSKIEKLKVNDYGELEVFIKERPAEGAANNALKKAIGKSFGIAASYVELTKGQKSKVKYFKLVFNFLNKDILYFKEKISDALKI